jgi:hypothetical protein
VKRARKNGYEQDAFSRYGKKYLNWRPGERKSAKVRANRRFRRVDERADIEERRGDV